MIAFIVVGAIGIVLVLASLILGEFIDFGDGTISGTALGVGAIVFGAVGVLVTAGALPVWVAYAGSLIAAALVVWAVQALVKHLRTTEDGVAQSLIGAQGVATTDIDTGRGEVSLDVAQELERRLAWSQEPIPEGSRVVVLEQAGSRVRVRQYFPED